MIFEKSINGWKYRSVMEIRTTQKELALNSLYTTDRIE